ncbi:phage baseplate plug family protein [Pseudomonas sp.]|uniref:phage baseplate plug family protein n=1 Tax=Pseudomonas sp. TaxID=306 RepID=UPI003FD79D8F
MTIQYVALPLFPDASYTYPIALEGVSYNLEFLYNERASLYYISLYDSDSNPIVLGEALVPTYPIFKDYTIPGLNGFIWMEEIATLINEPYKLYPDSIDQYYNLYYIYAG